MTGRYEHVACFVDDSAASRAALDHAVRLRDQLGAARLSVVHVIPPPVYFGVYYPPEATAPPSSPPWLEELGRAAPGAEVRFIDAFSAYPPAEAVRWASAEAVELIVAGSHRGLYRRITLGGFASHLAYHALCPVVLIPPTAVGEDAPA